jgi:hypothetical protein
VSSRHSLPGPMVQTSQMSGIVAQWVPGTSPGMTAMGLRQHCSAANGSRRCRLLRRGGFLGLGVCLGGFGLLALDALLLWLCLVRVVRCGALHQAVGIEDAGNAV